jgi:hypothetical protein
MVKNILGIMLILLSIFGIGCGTKMWTYRQGQVPSHIANVRTIPVYLDDNLSMEEEEAVKKSIKAWNGVFNGQIVIKIGGNFDSGNMEETIKLIKEAYNKGEGWYILTLDSRDKILEGDVEPGDGKLAFAVGGARGHMMVILEDRIGSRDITVILEHEEGHLLGAAHTLAPSLMFPSMGMGKDAVDCIDKITVAQVALVQNLDFNSLNYCVTPLFE